MDVTALLPWLRERQLIACPCCGRRSPQFDTHCHYCRAAIGEQARQAAIAASKRSERLGVVAALLVLIVLVLIFSYIPSLVGV